MSYGATQNNIESVILRDYDDENNNSSNKGQCIRNIVFGLFGLMAVLFIVYAFVDGSNEVSTENYLISSLTANEPKSCSYEDPCPFGYKCRDNKCCKDFFSQCKNNNDCCDSLECIKDVNFDEPVCQSPPPKCKNSEECPLRYSKCDNGKCCKSNFKPCSNDGQCCGDLKCIMNDDFGDYICSTSKPKKSASKKAPPKKASNQILAEEKKGTKGTKGKEEKCSYENPCPFGYKCGMDSKCCKGFFSTCKANTDCCTGLQCIKDLNADESVCQTPPPKCKKSDDCPLKYSKCSNGQCCKGDFSKCVNDGQCCGGLKCTMDEDYGDYICSKPPSKKAPSNKAGYNILAKESLSTLPAKCDYDNPCPLEYECGSNHKCCKPYYGRCNNDNDCCKTVKCLTEAATKKKVCLMPPEKCKTIEECGFGYGKCQNGQCCKSEFSKCTTMSDCCSGTKCLYNDDFEGYICLKPEPKKAGGGKKASNQILADEKIASNNKPESKIPAKCSYENPCPFGYKCNREDSKCCKPFFSKCKANIDCCVGLECIKDLKADESVCQTPPPQCKKSEDCTFKYPKCDNGKCCKGDFSSCSNEGDCCTGLKCTFDETFGDFTCLKPQPKKGEKKAAAPKQGKKSGNY